MTKRRRDAEFTAFVQRASPELLRIAWFITGDVEQAKELVQASLTKTYIAWARVRPNEAMAYTRTVLVNHQRDTWRKRRREVLVAHTTEPGAAAAPQSPPRHLADDVVDQQELMAALAQLPEQQRRVVVLRYYCDQSEAAVAEQLDIAVGTVKSTAARGLSSLRGHFATIDEGIR